MQVEALDRQEAAGIYEHLFKTDMLNGREPSQEASPASQSLARIATCHRSLIRSAAIYIPFSSLGRHFP